MIYVNKSSDHKILHYDSRGMNYIEIQENTVSVIPINRADFRKGGYTPLSLAVNRAKEGKSKIYAVCANEYANIEMVEIEDYKALLGAFGASVCEHRHHITWDYSQSDNGSSTARVRMTFKCGCVLNSDTKRAIQKELKEQYGIGIVLGSVPWFNDSDTVEIGVRRCDIKGKPHELK